MLKTPIGRLRAIGIIEGFSYLILLGIAMPLKYFSGLPLAVKIVGSLHGALFILFCAALTHVILERRWPMMRASFVFISSLVPFGTFMIDGRLRQEDRTLRNIKT